MVCNATSYSILVISVYISFIDGGKPLTCYMSLTNFITYCCIGYKSKKWLDSKWWQKFIQIGPVMTGRIYLKIFTADDWCKWLQKFTWPYLGCWAKKKDSVDYSLVWHCHFFSRSQTGPGFPSANVVFNDLSDCWFILVELWSIY